MKLLISGLVFSMSIGGCRLLSERAADHLRDLGHKDVMCSRESHGSSICMADGVQYRCVVSNTESCSDHYSAACERFSAERDLP